jgi:hypothetical protein
MPITSVGAIYATRSKLLRRIYIPHADDAEIQAQYVVDMLHEHAQFEDGSVSVEAELMDMLTRMQTGRFKVFKHLLDWLEEFRPYHRKAARL